MKFFNYSNLTSIRMNDDNTVSIYDEGITLIFDEKDKPRFVNAKTGETVTEYSGLATDKNNVRSWAIAYVKASGTSNKHYHNERKEIYYIVSGIAKIVIDTEESILSPGECIEIHPKQIHQIFNVGDEPLALIVRCSPSWIASDYCIANDLKMTCC